MPASPDTTAAAMTPGAGLECRRVTKCFGAVQAWRDVSFSVGPRGAHALVGENGAGKRSSCVLRNALPQIPGATFYDRLIAGLAVIAIVVMDQTLLKRRG